MRCDVRKPGRCSGAGASSHFLRLVSAPRARFTKQPAGAKLDRVVKIRIGTAATIEPAGATVGVPRNRTHRVDAKENKRLYTLIGQRSAIIADLPVELVPRRGLWS